MSTLTSAEVATRHRRRLRRTVMRWLVTFAGFPLGGLAGHARRRTRRQPRRRPSSAGCSPAWCSVRCRRGRCGRPRPPALLGRSPRRVGLTSGSAAGASPSASAQVSATRQSRAPSPARGRPRPGRGAAAADRPLVAAGLAGATWPRSGPSAGQSPPPIGVAGRRAVHRLRLRRRRHRDRADRGPAAPAPLRRPAPRPPRGAASMTRHVVFGTGQIGRPRRPATRGPGHHVVAVNRSGRGDLPGRRRRRRRRHRPARSPPGSARAPTSSTSA